MNTHKWEWMKNPWKLGKYLFVFEIISKFIVMRVIKTCEFQLKLVVAKLESQILSNVMGVANTFLFLKGFHVSNEAVNCVNDRRYPNFPIPGVAGIVVSRSGILLLRRDKNPGKGLWTFPGGGVEVGETQKEALRREIKEEAGIDAEILDFFTTFDIIIEDGSGKVLYHFLLNHYFARALSEEVRPEFPDGEVNWFHLDSLPEDEMPSKVVGLLYEAEVQISQIIHEYFAQ
ncbi:MAG: NUDIX domain-containing protein [Candidatus Lokiarchaeota archaeon]|nr:NUDIX domain-containing protein [Candidatus Lokiarchaeota archaeon]